MSGKPSRLAVIAALSVMMAAPALTAEGVHIDELLVATSIPESQRDATVKAARAFYEFWNTGDEADLERAIAPTFTDHTLPSGRPQGPQGPAFASRHFRAAVPDLAVRVEKMIVAGDYVTVHMKFTGHFTGKFGQTQGKGKPIEFIATDLVKVENGRITRSRRLAVAPLHHGAPRCDGCATLRTTMKASPHRHKRVLSHGSPADPSDPWNSHAAPVSPRQNGQR
jgi:predicted ester cyclase